MHFLDGQKKHDHMAKLVKQQPYAELPMECACQKHGCLNRTTHAIWHRNKHSFLLRPLCPKCYEIANQPSQAAPMAKETQQTVAPVANAEPSLSKPPATKRSEAKPKSAEPTNKELSERIARLEAIPFKQRTMVEAQELNDLLIMRKKRTRKK